MPLFIEVNPANVKFGKFTAGKKYEVLSDIPGKDANQRRSFKVQDDDGTEHYLLANYVSKIHDDHSN